MKLTVFKSRRGRPSQYLQQALQLNSIRQPLSDIMVQTNNLNIQENNSTDKVVKQNVLSETATTEEMKENHNILQRPSSVTSEKSTENYYHGNMDSNTPLQPYSTISTPKTTQVLSNGHHKLTEEVDNVRAPLREDVTSTPSFCDKEKHNSSASSTNSSETDVSRSPMSISDSSLEVSPESTGRSVASPLLGPKETSTPLQAPPQQPARRRPGRPPGSTKKRMQTYAEYRKKGDSNNTSAEDFSLRKFFEAGGRDYNEYLDWLKKRQQAQQTASAVMMNQMPSYPAIPSSMIPTTTTSNMPQIAQFATSPSVFNSSKSAMTLPPPPYRPPMLVPQPATLPHGVRSDMVPVPVSIPSIQGFPTILPAPAPISTPHRHPTHVPQPHHHHHQPQLSLQNQDSNALDLSAPTRKRKSEGGSSSDDELPSPGSAKMSRDMSGSPVIVGTTLVAPGCRSPPASISPVHHSVSNTLTYKADINGNVTSPMSLSDQGDATESSTELDLSSWDVENVVSFINTVPGCQEYSEVFREHKIDGATLPHLSEEHLLNFVKMKLGPAIKLRLAIARLKPTTAQ